jgi:hypothetical protein
MRDLPFSVTATKIARAAQSYALAFTLARTLQSWSSFARKIFCAGDKKE